MEKFQLLMFIGRRKVRVPNPAVSDRIRGNGFELEEGRF